MRHQRQLSDFFPVMISTFICMFLLALVYVMQYYFPVAYVYFCVEDSWAEYGTFVFFFMAGLFLARRIQQNPLLRRPGYALLSLGLILIGMEEISWGQRLFGIETPYIISQHNAQSELNIHNLFHFHAQTAFCYAILIWAVFWPELAGQVSFVKKFSDKLGIPLVPRKFYPYFILGLTVKLFDVIVIHEEIGELFLGIAFFLFAGEIFCRLGRNTDLKSALQPWRFTGLSVLAGTATVFFLIMVAPQNVYAFKYWLHILAIQEYPKRGLYRQAQEVFRHIVTHKELKNDQTLLDYGLFLTSIGDPKAQDVFMDALREARISAQLTPEKPKPNLLAGKILKLLNRHNEAENEFNEALKKDQARLLTATLNWERVTAHQSMGETYLAMEDREMAAQQFEKAYVDAEDGRTKKEIQKALEAIHQSLK